MAEPVIFELSVPGRKACVLPECDVPEVAVEELLPREMLRCRPPGLPEVSEVDVIRHFTRLSKMNYGVDDGFYPLGSCTMKYNPKVNERVARLAGFTHLHPYQPEELVQGALQIMYELDRYLSEVTGMSRFSLQPAAGAHGELTAMFMVKAYHLYRRDYARKQVIIPDSAHGTNPASAAMAGFQVVEVKSDARGGVDLAELEKLLSDKTAAIMLTIPNTLGLFDENILTITRMAHEAGAVVYYDGANLNAIMGVARPGDLGFDIVHLNLHKTFSAPHGGGGPGSGPVGVKDFLEPFLPVPVVEYDPREKRYYLDENRPLSIGKIKAFYGNFGVALKAYCYIRLLGEDGLRKVSENAVLNANYLMRRLSAHYDLPYDRPCLHEFVITPRRLLAQGVRTLDIAKRLLDYGFHPPTVYFPLIVDEAMMVEPTETEGLETLDRFAQAMEEILEEALSQPEVLKTAPHTTPVKRVDEVTANRKPIVRWRRG